VLGHVAHLCILNVPYVEGMRACIAKSRRQGRLSYGPYRHPWFGRWFTNTMEPPPKRRMPTAKGMVPDPDLDGSEVGPKFARIQDDLSQLMDDAWGVDLGKARFSSPFLRVVRLSLGTGLSLLLAHNRRHVWLARRGHGLGRISLEGRPEARAARVASYAVNRWRSRGVSLWSTDFRVCSPLELRLNANPRPLSRRRRSLR